MYVVMVGCSGACSLSSHLMKPTRHDFPVRSFVQVKSETLWEGCEVNEETEKPECQKALMRAVSSGTFIRHSAVDASISYVLTAGHSCKSTKRPTRVVADVTVKHLAQRFILIDYDGGEHQASVLAIDTRFDMCVLVVQAVYIKPPVVRLAKKEPLRGELVYNMAAPHGIVFPKMVLTFDGYFAGYSPEGFAMYSIPTKPGSSGSPIININNELVSIIFAGYRSMENIGVASPLVALKVFLRNSIGRAEMKAWAHLNNGVNKTETTTTKMMKNIHSTLSEYFHLHDVHNKGNNEAPL